jgi:hypothetical protein
MRIRVEYGLGHVGHHRGAAPVVEMPLRDGGDDLVPGRDRILARKRWTLPRAGATRHEDGPTTNLTSSASTRDNIARAT